MDMFTYCSCWINSAVLAFHGAHEGYYSVSSSSCLVDCGELEAVGPSISRRFPAQKQLVMHEPARSLCCMKLILATAVHNTYTHTHTHRLLVGSHAAIAQ